LPGTPGFIGDWRVNGRTVHVTAATIIDQEHAPVAVGASVEIKGTIRADGSIDASKIETKSASDDSGGSGNEGQSGKVNGVIQNLPAGSNLIGDWMINNSVVHVTSSTKLKAEHGAFAVGTRVKAKGLKLADGSLVATKIQVAD
jgi:urocanate hydratase